MPFSDTTDILCGLAVEHLNLLGFVDVRIDDSDEDFTAKWVTPPRTGPAGPDRHWYLGVAGTDYPFVESPGIDVVFIRPKEDGRGDDQISLDDFAHLDRLLLVEGYLRLAISPD